ncbi:hypothetical protein [Nonomuraea sp. LPB2021202275-12-8]|uniref:hypothetical protein n=1 Tax=Nonomuraea sp. LPB2021202275-12-8 TaxID=3120159 RepID=UPI00300C566F
MADMHDERQSRERRYLSEESTTQLEPTSDTGGIAAIDSGRAAPKHVWRSAMQWRS